MARVYSVAAGPPSKPNKTHHPFPCPNPQKRGKAAGIGSFVLLGRHRRALDMDLCLMPHIPHASCSRTLSLALTLRASNQTAQTQLYLSYSRDFSTVWPRTASASLAGLSGPQSPCWIAFVELALPENNIPDMRER
jgi:hypothetical protein